MQSLLPKQGNMIEMVCADNIVKQIVFNVDELKEFGLEHTDIGVKYNTSKDRFIELDLTDNEIKMLKKQVKLLDEAGQITRQNYILCQKINELI